MESSAKQNAAQSHQVLLYDRALHPELFDLSERRVVRAEGFEFEAWLMPGGHLLRFERGPLCACELTTDQESGLPENGVVTTFLCAGEREHEHAFNGSDVNYLASVQTETLTENLYLNTLEELRAFGRESGAMIHEFNDDSGPCMSMIDVQRYAGEVHAQSFHLLCGQQGMVLRTQSIFELKAAKRA